MRRIDTEAHFFTPGYTAYLRSRRSPPRAEATERGMRCWDEPSLPDFSHVRGTRLVQALCEVAEVRVAAMDAAGIDVQLLSISTPGCEQFEPADAAAVARQSNDELAGLIAAHPGRFAGLAALAPDPDQPEQAAAELQRCVRELGFRGVKINSHLRGGFLDDRRFDALLAAAADLGAPIYLHPALPHAAMAGPYLDYGFDLAGPSLGFGAETALHAMRLILGGVFDRHPSLQVVLGHMGEALPFWLYRLDFAVTRPKAGPERHPRLERKPSEYLGANFYFTTSGNFRYSAMVPALLEFGTERMMFASDYPYEDMGRAAEFADSVPLSQADRRRLNWSTAAALFGIG
jgi:predicted TIM-barrel fold metal-dependent hydrolase